MYQSLFRPRPEILLKKRLWHRCYPVNFAKFVGTHSLTEHIWWLLSLRFSFLIRNLQHIEQISAILFLLMEIFVTKAFCFFLLHFYSKFIK